MSEIVLFLVKYHNDQKAGMITNADLQNRATGNKKAIADFGGKPIAQYGSYGEYDMVFIYEMPDKKALAANLHLTDAYGLAKYCKAIPLVTAEDFAASLALAGATPTEYGPAANTES